MKAILDEMLAALSRGERVVLSSILASSGSVPRGAGAKMAVFEDDRVLGTIGGGAVERLSIQRAQDALKNGGSNELKSYNLHPSEVASTGMICGGAVTVYFQFFAPEQAADVVAGVEPARSGVVGIPAAFAVDAVERTEFRLRGQQIDAQREAQPPRMHRAEDDVVIE